MKSILLSGIFSATALISVGQTVVQTPAYSWHGDTITQGVFMATAPSATEIISTYSAQPGYYMGIDKQWKVRNDICPYP